MRQSEWIENETTWKSELQDMINQGISQALQMHSDVYRNKGSRNSRERVERLLYARRGLDILISSLEEELATLEDSTAASSMAYEKTTQKVVHLLPSGEALGFPQKRKDVKALLARNRLAAKRIDNAVESLRDDPYYALLHLKYTEGLSEEEIAEELCCDPSTVRRNKNRLLERLAVVFFGIDVLEMI